MLWIFLTVMQMIGLISDELVYKPAIVAIATIAFQRTKIRTKKSFVITNFIPFDQKINDL